MADEINTEVETSTAEPIAQEVLELEDRARAQGWVPQDEWQGTGKWRDAEEFVERGELFSKIDHQGRALKQTQQALTALTKHYEKVQETEYKRALSDLRAQKKEALENADADEVLRLDDEIADLRESKVQPTPQAQPQSEGLHPEFASWVQQNQWYAGTTAKHAAMRAWADRYGAELVSNGSSPSAALKLVANQVRVEFPANFSNPNRTRPSSVEGGNSPASRSRAGSFELSDMEEKIMKTLVRNGTLSKEQYINDIKKQRGVQ